MKTKRFTRSRFFRPFAIVVVALAATTLIASPAQAAYIGNGLLESLSRPGQCLDSNGTSVYINPCDSNNIWQHWVINTTGARPNGYDQVTIRHAQEDKEPGPGRYLAQFYAQSLIGNMGGFAVNVQPGNSSAKLYFDGVGSSWSNVALQSLNSESYWVAACIDVTHPAWNLGCNGTLDQRWKFNH